MRNPSTRRLAPILLFQALLLIFAPFGSALAQSSPAQDIHDVDLPGRILFTTYSGDAHAASVAGFGPQDLYVVDPDGTNRVRVSSAWLERYGGMSSAWYLPSLDGQWMAARADNQTLAISKVTGEFVAEYPTYPSLAYPIAWSPNARYLLLYDSRDDASGGKVEDIFRLDACTGEVIQLTDEPERNLFAAWSPDGTQIAYMRDYQLWLMNADGSGQRRIDSLAETRDLAWSPDGTMIAFEGTDVVDYRTVWDIWLLDVATGEQVQLTDTPDDPNTHTVENDEYLPIWSPDSKSIAFQRIPGATGKEMSIHTLDVASHREVTIVPEGFNMLIAWLPETQVISQWAGLERGLWVDGHMAQVQFSPGDGLEPPSYLFGPGMADPARLIEKGIDGFRLSLDGEPLLEEAEMRELLDLYAAAYALYGWPNHSFTDLDTIDKDIDRINDNLIMKAVNLSIVLQSEDDKARNALRAMLADTEETDEFAANTIRLAGEVEDIVDMSDAILKVAHQTDSPIVHEITGLMSEQLVDWKIVDSKLSIPGLPSGIPSSVNSLEVVTLLLQMYYQDYLAAEKIDAMRHYFDDANTHSGATIEKYERALDVVAQEASDLSSRRADMVKDFLRDAAVDEGIDLTMPLAASFAGWAVTKLGFEQLGSFMASNLAVSVGAGVSIGTYLMGTDKLYEHLVIAEAANELRKLIQMDRIALEVRAAQTDDGPYDGELARLYRATLMSEMMAATTVRNSYVDGVEATISKGWFSPVTWLNEISERYTGEDWREAVDGLRAHAADEAAKHEYQFVNRPSHDTLVQLALHQVASSPAAEWPVCEQGYGELVVPSEPLDTARVGGASQETPVTPAALAAVQDPKETATADDASSGSLSISELLESVSPVRSTPGQTDEPASGDSTGGDSSAVRAGAIDLDQATNATVTAQTLNLRSGPSTQHDVVLQLTEGQRVTVIGRSADSSWTQIEGQDLAASGWVSSEYLALDDGSRPLSASADAMVSPAVPAQPATTRPTATPPPAAVHCPVAVHPTFAHLFERVDKAQSGCPLGDAYQQTVAYQPFENGVMYWRQSAPGAPNGIIYVLHNTGAWSQYIDPWVDGEPERAGYTPPAGRIEPRRGFGKVWRESLGGPNSSLGWALQDESGSDFALVQDFQNQGTMIQYPDLAPVFLPDGLSWLR